VPKLAVVGQPIAHSLSPAMQTAALAEAGLAGEWTYEAIELAPEEFDAAMDRLSRDPSWVGVNVTIPHKEAALAIATEASEAARAIGAANTLTFYREAGERPAIAAENTDAPAVVEAVRAQSVELAGCRALVLGAGGSARAAVWGLGSEGAEVTIWNRTHERGAALAAEFGASLVAAGDLPAPEGFDLLVNTTSVGLDASPSRETSPILKPFGFAADQLNEDQVVVDLAYGKTETELLRAAKERGARTVDGREILVRQGARSFTLWTGLAAPLAAMNRKVLPRHP
jgi:shikimate dehydrogenase